MHFEDVQKAKEIISTYNHSNEMVQKFNDELIEILLPTSISPRRSAQFLINGKQYTLPMAIEESSVVAAQVSLQNFGPPEVVQAQILEPKK